MELRLGFMSYEELAEWFGVKIGTFNNAKKKKLQVLKQFADYSVVCKGVEIKEIYIPVYSKKGSQAYQVVKQNFDRVWGKDSTDPNFDTCRIVADKISDSHKELAVKDDTIYKYVMNVRTEKYGHPCFEEYGELGHCFSAWGVKEINNEGAVYVRPLTADEEKIKNKLLKKYFGVKEESEAALIEKEVMIHSLVDSGQISKERAYDIIADMKNYNRGSYLSFFKELKKELDADVIRGTVLARAEQPVAIEWTGA